MPRIARSTAVAVAGTMAIAALAAPGLAGAAPSSLVVPARVVAVAGAPAGGALLRFAVPEGTLEGATLRIHAGARSARGLSVRASSCPREGWSASARGAGRRAAAASARSAPEQTGARVAVARRLARGWNVVALPARALAPGATTCLRVTPARGVRLKLHARGARAPRLSLRPAPPATAARAPAAARPAPATARRPVPKPAGQATTWSAPPPPSTPGYCAAVAAGWRGSGRTISVAPGDSLQAAVDAAAPGDTVELADGTYRRVRVTLRKAIRLRARTPRGAVLVGNATPRTANDTSVGAPDGAAVTVRASGAVVEGLDIRFYAGGVDVADADGVVVQGNRITSNYNVGIQLWDTRDAEVRCNELLDPYLADDPVASLTAGSISDAQMDYGVAVYGSIAPRVHHNYLHGVFNQALSFKEGNLDPYAGYNTFEGFNLTALFFGQNVPHNGPYEHTGLPVGLDHGTLVAEYNVFRNVSGLRGGQRVVYFARSPIRVWHVDGATTLRGNVVESAQQGFLLECRSGADAGCAAGTILVQHNTVGGRVQGLSGALTDVNRTAGVLLYDGLPARVTVDANVFAMVPAAVRAYGGGVAGIPSLTETANVVRATSPADLRLREARAQTDPDLSHADAYRTG